MQDQRVQASANQSIDHDRSVETQLRQAELRPTRQRIALASLLFAKGDRHLTAEDLHEEARSARIPVSLATVYNTLHDKPDLPMGG